MDAEMDRLRKKYDKLVKIITKSRDLEKIGRAHDEMDRLLDKMAVHGRKN